MKDTQPDLHTSSILSLNLLKQNYTPLSRSPITSLLLNPLVTVSPHFTCAISSTCLRNISCDKLSFCSLYNTYSLVLLAPCLYSFLISSASKSCSASGLVFKPSFLLYLHWFPLWFCPGCGLKHHFQISISSLGLSSERQLLYLVDLCIAYLFPP
jgi:hypothetical protein